MVSLLLTSNIFYILNFKQVKAGWNDSKNRTKKSSFEKLKNDFGTEIPPKIACNTIYRKLYFLYFLFITFLIKTLLPLELRTGNMVQKWGKLLSYIFYSFCWMTHKLLNVRSSFFQISKFRRFLTFLKNFFSEYKTIQSQNASSATFHTAENLNNLNTISNNQTNFNPYDSYKYTDFSPICKFRIFTQISSICFISFP